MLCLEFSEATTLDIAHKADDCCEKASGLDSWDVAADVLIKIYTRTSPNLKAATVRQITVMSHEFMKKITHGQVPISNLPEKANNSDVTWVSKKTTRKRSWLIYIEGICIFIFAVETFCCCWSQNMHGVARHLLDWVAIYYCKCINIGEGDQSEGDVSSLLILSRRTVNKTKFKIMKLHSS